VGTNLIANGTFDSNISGWAVYAGSSNNVTATWDNTGKLSGGCFKLAFASPSGNMFNTLNAFNYQDIFPVTTGPCTCWPLMLWGALRTACCELCCCRTALRGPT